MSRNKILCFIWIHDWIPRVIQFASDKMFETKTKCVTRRIDWVYFKFPYLNLKHSILCVFKALRKLKFSISIAQTNIECLKGCAIQIQHHSGTPCVIQCKQVVGRSFEAKLCTSAPTNCNVDCTFRLVQAEWLSKARAANYASQRDNKVVSGSTQTALLTAEKTSQKDAEVVSESCAHEREKFLLKIYFATTWKAHSTSASFYLISIACAKLCLSRSVSRAN